MNYRTINGKSRHVNGWKPDPADASVPHIMIHKGSNLPPQLRLKWVGIRDQGQVGDCVENGVLECAEVLGAPVLSRLYLYWYVRQYDGDPPDADNGSSVASAMEVYTARGVPTESVWNYDNAETKFSVQPPDGLENEASKHKALLYYRCPNLVTLKASLAQGFPGVLGMAVPQNLMESDCARTGDIHWPEPGEQYEGGHCMAVCGYDDSKKIGDETGALILANSWGEGWGDSGFCHLPYRYIDESVVHSIYSFRRVTL